MPLFQAVSIALFFLLFAIWTFYHAFVSATSDKDFFTIVFVVVGLPLGLLGIRLVFATTSDRQKGFFSPVTLYSIAILIMISEIYLVVFEGQTNAGYSIAIGLAIIALAKKRAADRNKQRFK